MTMTNEQTGRDELTSREVPGRPQRGGAMIYTVGYQRLTPDALTALCVALQINAVIDVRSVSSSRRPGFYRGALSSLLGSRYEWRGDRLGGRPGPTERGLAQLAVERRRVLLLCLEESPGDCHRHHKIGLPLAKTGHSVTHVYRDELIDALELQRAIDESDGYTMGKSVW